jgi:amino-acid N-acetyltransferase
MSLLSTIFGGGAAVGAFVVPTTSTTRSTNTRQRRASPFRRFALKKAAGGAGGRPSSSSSPSAVGPLRYTNDPLKVAETRGVNDRDNTSFYASPEALFQREPWSVADPASVEFVGTAAAAPAPPRRTGDDDASRTTRKSFYHPFAAMMQGSASYIASHAGSMAVIYIPGDILEEKTSLLEDIALTWLLGMKIVLVVGCRNDQVDECRSLDLSSAFECHNVLKVTTKETLRRVEEEAGYLRTEIERKLNRCLRAHGGGGVVADEERKSDPSSAPPEGNVVSGNFYTARQFGVIRGEDFQYTGYCSSVNNDKIEGVLKNNDVCLLTTVGSSRTGELVNVNGYHLAASVAASLEANKLIYMATENTVMRMKKNDGDDDDSSSEEDRTAVPVQELPLSFARAVADHHRVVCHNTGFATFDGARRSLDSAAVELLLHLGWSAWALDRGVQRAHVVNTADGALLEELFTAANGASTCLYRDDEMLDDDDCLQPEDWDAFFSCATAQNETVALFS